MNERKRLWLIEGFIDEQRFLVEKLPARTSTKEIRSLLQRLASRHLSVDEIVGASRAKRAVQSYDGLAVRTCDTGSHTFSVGLRAIYSARLGSAFEYDEISQRYTELVDPDITSPPPAFRRTT